MTKQAGTQSVPSLRQKPFQSNGIGFVTPLVAFKRVIHLITDYPFESSYPMVRAPRFEPSIGGSFFVVVG